MNHGNARLDLTLTPPDLGRVDIRVERGDDGRAAVSLRVERPETLATLQRDAPQLHAALDRAGVNVERSVSLALAEPSGMSSSSSSTSGFSGSHGDGTGQQPRNAVATNAIGSDEGDDPSAIERIAVATPRADGLDITA